MEMIVEFPGGSRVDARFGEYIVKTDQPKEGGGDGSAPTPFDTFLASLGTCAGIYVLGFCRHRGVDPAGIRLVQNTEVDTSTGLVTKVLLDIQLPAAFPEKYRAAVIQAAELCKVKKHFEHPPIIDVSTSLHT